MTTEIFGIFVNETQWSSIKPMGASDQLDDVALPDETRSSEISPAALEAIRFAFSFVLGFTLCIFGMVGSVLNMIILLRHRFNDTTSILLLYLSVADFFVSSAHMLVKIAIVLVPYNPIAGEDIFIFYTLYIEIPNQTGILISIYFVTLVAIVRMVAVCFPFRVSSLITRFRVKLVSLIGVAVIVGLDSPLYNTFRTDEFTYVENNYTDIFVTLTTFFTDNFYIFYVYGFVYGLIVSNLIPIVIIAVCTVMIITSITKNWNSLNKLSSTESKMRIKEMKSAKTSLAVSISMMVTVLLPSFLMEMFEMFVIDTMYTSHAVESVVEEIMPLVYQLNSSVNFILYVATSPKFAKLFINDFCFCFRRLKRLKS